MNNIITIVPWTRVNDSWMTSDAIDASLVTKSVTDHRLYGRPGSIDPQPAFYEHFACDIVTETVLNYPYPYITEKTLRPIATKRMFIILGAPGILELLHSKGFETFGDLIDESYDQIQDPEQRFLAVITEVEKFCALPLEQIKTYLHSNHQRFQHNFDVLKNLPQQELDEFLTLLDQ